MQKARVGTKQSSAGVCPLLATPPHQWTSSPTSYQTSSSWRAAISCVCSCRTVLNQKLALVDTHQKEEVRRLWVIYPRDPLEKGLLFSGFALQEVNDEGRLFDGNSQNIQPLVMNWKQRVTSPHHSVWFHRSCSPGQCSNPNWFQPPSVPHLRLPVMQLDERVGQAFHQQLHERATFLFAHCVNMVMERKNVLIVSQPPCYGRDVLLVFCCIIFHEMSTRAVYNACAPIR